MYTYIQYMYMNEGYLYSSSRHHRMVEERVIDTCVCICPRVCVYYPLLLVCIHVLHVTLAIRDKHE